MGADPLQGTDPLQVLGTDPFWVLNSLCAPNFKICNQNHEEITII